jgi:hypothetical protein
MGKQASPAAPDYSGIASADTTAANNEYALGTSQLDWAQSQFNTVWPYAQQYLQQQTSSSAAATQTAQDEQAFYDSTYKPIESQFASQATNYDSPAQANANAGSATADVANSFDASRASALSSLESYGIDPSQTRYQALDLGTEVSQAAATAAAGTQSRLNTQATGLALEGDAINIGRGYSNSVAQSYATATSAGASGIGAANSTIANGANTMGTATQYMGLGAGANAGAVSALNTGFQDSLAGAQFQAQQSQSFSSGIGSLVGGALGAYAFNPGAF